MDMRRRGQRQPAPEPVSLQFGEWLPDLGDYDNPGSPHAVNCIPEPRSFSTLRDTEAFSAALTDRCVGAYWSLDVSQEKVNFAGDAQRLYIYDAVNAAWDNVSKAGNYATATRWEFSRFGSRVIAVSKLNPTQYYDTETSSLFEDLPNAPKAACIGVVRDFVVLGDINDGTDKEDVVAWSGFNNSEVWGTSRPLQSDEQALRGRSGRIQAIVPGQRGYIFTEQSIWSMDYVGPPVVFRFDEIFKGMGTPSPTSVCWGAGAIWYYGYDGFMRWPMGGAPERIGANKVDKWFAENINGTQFFSIRGAVDKINGLVFWAFRRNSETVNDTLLIYNYRANRWGYGEVDTEVISEYAPEGFTLDGLDNILADIDTDSFNVDSPVYLGREISLLVFDSDSKAARLTGDPLEATIESRKWETGARDGRFKVQSIESLVENAGTPPTVVAQLGTAPELKDDIAWSADLSQSARGRHDIIREGRIIKVRVKITGAFKHAYGARLRGKPTGGV